MLSADQGDLIRFSILNIETGDPPAGWGVRRAISNPPPAETAEVFERNETVFFTSIFCGSSSQSHRTFPLTIRGGMLTSAFLDFATHSARLDSLGEMNGL
jgi:hypothetical protein